MGVLGTGHSGLLRIDLEEQFHSAAEGFCE
jgi:hypothetical protein